MIGSCANKVTITRSYIYSTSWAKGQYQGFTISKIKLLDSTVSVFNKGFNHYFLDKHIVDSSFCFIEITKTESRDLHEKIYFDKKETKRKWRSCWNGLVESDTRAKEAMGSFGCLRTLDDLPSRAVLLRYLQQARKLNEDGVKAPRTKTARKKPFAMHADFAKALERRAPARKTFASFSPSQQREYTEWIAEAKKDDTRARRIETAVDWLAEGKRRNWKYENC